MTVQNMFLFYYAYDLKMEKNVLLESENKSEIDDLSTFQREKSLRCAEVENFQKDQIR